MVSLGRWSQGRGWSGSVCSVFRLPWSTPRRTPGRGGCGKCVACWLAEWAGESAAWSYLKWQPSAPCGRYAGTAHGCNPHHICTYCQGILFYHWFLQCSNNLNIRQLFTCLTVIFSKVCYPAGTMWPTVIYYITFLSMVYFQTVCNNTCTWVDEHTLQCTLLSWQCSLQVWWCWLKPHKKRV